ncbi:MAG: hypothetical protein CMN57_02055 [Gammaproteobacteria bacterium]|nr:hypothetical protein [Gammaproteobacteria bacterium]
MPSTSHKLLKIMAVICSWGAAGVTAGPVYTWRDADGGTHYSDTAPPAHLDYQTLELPPPPPAQPAAAGDYRAVLDVAERLQAARLERERLRLEREQAAVEALQTRQATAPGDDAPRDSAPWLVFPHPLRPHPGPHVRPHPHPDQPPVRHAPAPGPKTPSPTRAIVD